MIEKIITITNPETILIRIGLAIILLFLGLIIGKVISKLLRNGAQKISLQKTIKPGFVKSFIVIIKWAIYILFLSFALNQLEIPQITNWITSALVVVPALVCGLILIVIGFALAVYLRNLVSESEISDKKTLSTILYYFVLYVFIVFALKTALIAQDKTMVNIIIIILTTILATAITYTQARK